MNRNCRTLRPALESLEGKRLMTAGLVYSLSAVPVEALGGHQQSIELTMTITNTSTHAQFVKLGSSVDGFVAKENGQTVWQSNGEISALTIQLVDLAPGKSVQVSSSWNEESNMGPMKTGTPIAGLVTFYDQMDPSDTATVFIPVHDPITLVPLKPI